MSPSLVKTAGTSSESATSELKRAENLRETHAFASDSETCIWNRNNNKTGMQKKKDEDTHSNSPSLFRKGFYSLGEEDKEAEKKRISFKCLSRF